MKISKVKTAFKIADVRLKDGTTKLDFVYLEKIYNENGDLLPTEILTMNVARVYLIVVNGEIYKIGGSQDKGGIKRTLRIYQDGGKNGRPSIRSFGVWYFLYYTLLEGKNIEFYMIYQDNFETEVKGLFGYNYVPDASINYKLLEEQCERDYLSMENNKYPKWNVQEQAADWPEDIKTEHAKIMQKSVKKKSKVVRKKIAL